LLPTHPTARRLALAGWAVAAIGGTVAVWWLSSYLETLTALAQTDREAALALFRSRAMPALLVVVGVAVAAGALVLRQGLQLARSAEGQGRTLGNVMAAAGFVLAAAPLILISLVFWLLRRA
jgi:type II secretory pathway component PulK